MQPSRSRALLGHYDYPTWARIMEIAGIIAYAGFAALTATQTTQQLFGLGEETPVPFWAFFILAPVIAYLMGDFMSGLVHCAADNFGEETTFFFGPAFIRPFRDHHRDPQGITRHDFVEVNGNSCLVNLIVIVPVYFFLRSSPGIWSLLLGIFSLFFTLSIVLTNQIHKWAHQRSGPRNGSENVSRERKLGGLLMFLQNRHLILNPGDHQIHHTPPFDRYYCITNGWLNPILEKMGFFVWLVRTFDWARPVSSDFPYSSPNPPSASPQGDGDNAKAA